RDGRGGEIAAVVLFSDPPQRIANFLPFCFGEKVVGDVIGDRDSLQQARDGVGFGAIRFVLRFMLPGAATGQSPLTRRLAVPLLSTESVSEGQMLRNRQVAHDGIKAVVKVFVNGVWRNRRDPGLPGRKS